MKSFGSTLEDLGWNEGFAADFAAYAAQGWVPGRLIRDNKITYGALLEGGRELEVILSGKVYHDAATDAELPAVGDWVALDLGGDEGDHVIRARLARQSFFSRKVSGPSTEEQVMAANVSIVAVLTEAGPDFSPRRLERYLALIARGGSKPVILVNKCDLFSEKENAAIVGAIRELDPLVPIHLISAWRRKGLKAVRDLLKPGVTVALAGSSGVGKSLLVNRLLGEEWQWTGEVNEVTGKGRHTTTARELMVLPKGGILIDNPGIKEVQMWTDELTLRERFADIERLAEQCRFQDCQHQTDRDCAIQAAMISGQLDGERFRGYLKLEQELLELRLKRKKRQMTLERRGKREVRIKARNREDRLDLEADQKPNHRRH